MNSHNYVWIPFETVRVEGCTEGVDPQHVIGCSSRFLRISSPPIQEARIQELPEHLPSLLHPAPLQHTVKFLICLAVWLSVCLSVCLRDVNF